MDYRPFTYIGVACIIIAQIAGRATGSHLVHIAFDLIALIFCIIGIVIYYKNKNKPKE